MAGSRVVGGLVVAALAALSCRSSSTASDGGASGSAGAWSRTALAGAQIVTTVAVDPKDPRTVFAGVAAGSAEQGFVRTRDGGKTWSKLGGNLPLRWAGFVAVAPRTGTVLVNPGVEGIWRSTNHGDSFVLATADPGGTNGLFFHPTSSVVWTVTSQRGCVRSNDDGATWARTPNTGLPLNQFTLGPLASDGAKLYLGTGGKGLYVSSDNGDTWTKTASAGLPDSSGGGDALAIVIAAGAILVETTRAGLFRSTDGAASFTRLDPRTRYEALAIDPSNAQIAYVSANDTTGGLLKTTNGGQSWSPIGPPQVGIHAVVVASDGALYAGTLGQGIWRLGGT
jgi:photosystem II stability/assembly factor-like uncharacterized protein